MWRAILLVALTVESAVAGNVGVTATLESCQAGCNDALALDKRCQLPVNSYECAIKYLKCNRTCRVVIGAVLTPSQVIPRPTHFAYGNASITFDSGLQNITVILNIANGSSPINGVHIHEAAPGANGNVVADLASLSPDGGWLTATVALDPAVAQRILKNPAAFYLDVHTQQFPPGAIRGQLAYDSGGTITYAADLRGNNEAPPVTTNAFGSAFVKLDLFNNTVTWDVVSSGIGSATASHIHRGAAGVAGPVIINFATTPGQIVGGHTSGSALIAQQQTANLQASDLTALQLASTAKDYYVNVHSSAFPGGEIRGPLLPVNEYEVAIAGRVTNSIAQTFVTDARIFNPSYQSSVAALLEYFTAGSVSGGVPNAATVVNIPPRGTAALDDVAGPSGLNVGGTTGALRVSSASELAVTSRIFVDLQSSGKGSFGQYAAGQLLAMGLRRGVMPQLSNRADGTGGFRTNTGFFNPNATPATVRLELRDAAGGLVAENTITLQAYSQQQNAIGTYFPGADLSNAANLTLSFDSSAPIFGYSAVNDNVSGDSIFVAAQIDPGVAGGNQ
jgi:hypothetical protein